MRFKSSSFGGKIQIHFDGFNLLQALTVIAYVFWFSFIRFWNYLPGSAEMFKQQHTVHKKKMREKQKIIKYCNDMLFPYLFTYSNETICLSSNK